MVFLKVFALVVICGAIWLTVRFIMTAGDQDAGVVNPLPEQDSPLKRIFSTPEPPPELAPKFFR